MSSLIATDLPTANWQPEVPVEVPSIYAPQLSQRLSAWRDVLFADIGYVVDAGTGIVEFAASIDRIEADHVNDDLIRVSKEVIRKRSIQFENAIAQGSVLKWHLSSPVYMNGRLSKVIGFGGYTARVSPIADEQFIIVDTCADWLGLHLHRTVAPDRVLANPSHAKILLSASTEAIIALDEQDRVVFMNAAAELICGEKLSRAQLRPVENVICLREREERLNISDLVQLCRATGSPVTLECELVRAGDNSVVQVAGKMLPVKDHLWLGLEVASIVLLRDIEENVELQERLLWQSSHDQLSGLKNRFELEKMIAEAFRKSAGLSAVRASLVHVGVDGLEMINNSCGPAGGDELLKRVAKMIQSCAGEHADSVARIGGDEFGILLDGMDLRRAASLADKISAGMKGLFVWGGDEIDVSACIGIVPLRRSMSSSEDVLLSSAMAMRRAKEGGRGEKVVMRSLKESDYKVNDLRTIGMIRKALDDKRVVLLFQKIAPIHPSKSAEHHQEIFVRLRSPAGNLLMPDSFIPVAERNHLMPQLDKAIIQAVAENMHSFPLTDIIAVNISGKTISSPGIIDFIIEQFHTAKLDPRRICFEITETAAIRNEQDAVDFAAAMRKLGCTISLDDFGAGHHNFLLLKSLAPEYVKIDGSFIRQMFDQDFNAQAIRSIVDMAEQVGAKVIAESVENQKTLDALKSMGVTFVQGWHIHRPEIVEGF
jgi:diguanylate cyclase (GGDEF)-like protein